MTLQEYIDLSEERRMEAALKVAQAHVPGTGRRILDSADEAGNAVAGSARVVTLEVQGELVPVTLAVVDLPGEAEAEGDPALSSGRHARKLAAVSVTIGDETHVFNLGGAAQAMSG